LFFLQNNALNLLYFSGEYCNPFVPKILILFGGIFMVHGSVSNIWQAKQ